MARINETEKKAFSDELDVLRGTTKGLWYMKMAMVELAPLD